MRRFMDKQRQASLSQIFKGNNQFLIDLVCPDNTSISRSHSIRDTVSDVLQESCKQLGINRTGIFGVALHECNEYRFISKNKSLYKFLPSEAIVSNETISSTNHSPFNNIKTCRLYLRVKIFLANIHVLSGSTLFYYYEQARLDSLRYQNWLEFGELTEIFHDIAAKAIWLKYGESWVEGVESRKLPLHFFLPISEQNDDTWSILTGKLKSMNDEFGFNGIPIIREDYSLAKLPLTKTDSNQSQATTSTRKNTVTEEDVVIVDDRDQIMLTVLIEMAKLPYHGVHFYHVSMTKDTEEKNLTNCILGIGPFGLTVVVSPYYTTWKESIYVTWNSVEEMRYEKNILHVKSSGHELLYRFVCLNEKEAKYLFRELKENRSFQLQAKNEKRTVTKKNSIGVLNSSPTGKSNTLNISPLPRRRTLSFSLLLFPRKYSSS
jgi:FERM C-terminal PH-like domain./FERM N-terminal domain.